jgi:hypothetical protein
MARSLSLRASDADRDAVAERLRHAAAEGRLEPEELEQRLHAALRARTYGELRWLTDDLPGKPVASGRHTTDVAPIARLAIQALILLAVLGVVLVVLALTAAWWVLCAVVWLTLRTSRGCGRRGGWNAGWRRPPHVWRV